MVDYGLGLAAAIEQLRDDLLTARASAASQDIQLPIDSMTVELKVVATKSVDGKAGFRIPIVNAEVGASGAWKHEDLQTVTVTFGAPVDRAGNPVKVAAASDAVKG